MRSTCRPRRSTGFISPFTCPALWHCVRADALSIRCRNARRLHRRAALPDVRLLALRCWSRWWSRSRPHHQRAGDAWRLHYEGAASTAKLPRLADRMANALPHHWAVVNTGISGNRLLRYGAGPRRHSRGSTGTCSVCRGSRPLFCWRVYNTSAAVWARRTRPNRSPTAEALEAAISRSSLARTNMHPGHRATLTPTRCFLRPAAARPHARPQYLDQDQRRLRWRDDFAR